MGGESLSVSQSAIVSKWFKGRELAFALGANLSISRLGSVVNGWVLPPTLRVTENLGTCFMIGFWICVMSNVASIGIGN